MPRATRCARRSSCTPSSRFAQTLLRGFAPLFAVMVLIGGLLLLEPDFGAFVVIVAIAFGILFVGGLDWRLFLGLALLLPVALAADPDRRAVPRAAADEFPRSVVGSAAQGLSAVAFADRVRSRRMVRRRTRGRASRSCSTCPRRTPISCSRSSPRSSASSASRPSSRCSRGCCFAPMRSDARRRDFRGRSPRWSRTASASGSASRRSSTWASTWACCPPRA